MFSLRDKFLGGSPCENRRGMGPGGFISGVGLLHAALPTPVSAGSGSKGLSQPPILGVPLTVHQKDTRAGLHRKLSEMADMADVAMAYVVEVSSRLPGGENERIGFAEGELGIQGDHVHESQA